jgi:hypothetical protein
MKISFYYIFISLNNPTPQKVPFLRQFTEIFEKNIFLSIIAFLALLTKNSILLDIFEKDGRKPDKDTRLLMAKK